MFFARAGRFDAGFGRNHDDATVAHAALCNDMIGQMLHGRRAALQSCDLHAVVIVEMHVQGGQRQVVMVVEVVDETIGQIARG